MKTLGIVGGIAPESTVDYYRSIIAAYRELKPGGSYPPIIINSIDLQKMLALVEMGAHEELTRYLLEEIHRLARAGADFALLASNTPHLVFDELQRLAPIPLISIVEAACQAAKDLGITKAGLLGTSFTMRAQFYAQVFSREGIIVVVPNPQEQAWVHDKYMNELVKAKFLPETREGLLEIINRMKEEEGIDGVILGGTELPLLLRMVTGTGLSFLNTTEIHVRRAVSEMLS